MGKQPRNTGMLHVPETGRSQLLLPSVEPAGKSGLLLLPVDPSIYGGVWRAKVLSFTLIIHRSKFRGQIQDCILLI